MTIGARAFSWGSWIAAGASPKEVGARAGHTSVSFTLDRYGGLFEGHDRELRDRLDAMFADASEGQVLALDRTASGPKWSQTAVEPRPREADGALTCCYGGVEVRGFEPPTSSVRASWG
jgi:hypothetical protein